MERLVPSAATDFVKMGLYRQMPAQTSVLPPSNRIARVNGANLAHHDAHGMASKVRAAIDGTCTAAMRCTSGLVGLDDVAHEFHGATGAALLGAMRELASQESPHGGSYADRVVMYIDYVIQADLGDRARPAMARCHGGGGAGQLDVARDVHEHRREHDGHRAAQRVARGAENGNGRTRGRRRDGAADPSPRRSLGGTPARSDAAELPRCPHVRLARRRVDPAQSEAPAIRRRHVPLYGRGPEGVLRIHLDSRPRGRSRPRGARQLRALAGGAARLPPAGFRRRAERVTTSPEASRDVVPHLCREWTLTAPAGSTRAPA